MGVTGAGKHRPRRFWFWLSLAGAIVVVIGLSFPIGWLMTWAFPRISSFSIVGPLTVALIAFAAFLSVVFFFQRRARKVG
jgi:hypothetical protein